MKEKLEKKCNDLRVELQEVVNEHNTVAQKHQEAEARLNELKKRAAVIELTLKELNDLLKPKKDTK